MKSLLTLIRLQQRKIDELKRVLAQLESQKQQLLDRSAQLADELARELELAAKQPDMSGFFGDFAERIRKRRAELAAEAQKIEKKIQDQSHQVRLAFGELKKYEIVRDRRIAERKAQEAKKETEALDEVAIMRDQRKRGE